VRDTEHGQQYVSSPESEPDCLVYKRTNHADGELVYEVPATSLDDATGAKVPTEPSYIIFNTAGTFIKNPHWAVVVVEEKEGGQAMGCSPRFPFAPVVVHSLDVVGFPPGLPRRLRLRLLRLQQARCVHRLRNGVP